MSSEFLTGGGLGRELPTAQSPDEIVRMVAAAARWQLGAAVEAHPVEPGRAVGGLVGDCIEQDRPVVDVTACAVPVRASGRVVGVLVSPIEPPERRMVLDVLETMALVAGLSIERLERAEPGRLPTAEQPPGVDGHDGPRVLLLDLDGVIVEDGGAAGRPDGDRWRGRPHRELLAQLLGADERARAEGIVRRAGEGRVATGRFAVADSDEVVALDVDAVPVGAAGQVVGVRATVRRVAASMAGQPPPTALTPGVLGLTAMAHEVRTPLQGILGAVSLLDGGGAFDQGEALDMIRSGAEHLATMLDDLLQLASVGALGRRREPEPFDLAHLVDSVTALSGAEAPAGAVTVTTAIRPGTPDRLVGDARRIRQVLVNVVANAVKYTDTGHVHLEAALADGPTSMVRFTVDDSGIGVPFDELPRVFEPLMRSSLALRRGVPGSGLGLSVVADLVRSMRGSVVMHSVEGKGTTVEVTLPIEVSGLTGPLAAHRLELVPGSAPSPLDGPVGPGSSVLVVDDDPLSRRVMAALLARLGIDADVAADAPGAREAMAGRAYDLVLMDLRLGTRSGADLVSALVAEGGARPRFVAVTADGSAAAVERCEEAGFDGFVAKPVNLATMRGIVDADGSGLAPDAQSEADGQLLASRSGSRPRGAPPRNGG